jgi:outer membrane protein insertion porin family
MRSIMKRFAILATLFLAAAAVAAQEAPQAEASSGAGAAAGAAAAADWFWGKPIDSVQWEGVVHADKRELEYATKPYIGKEFTEELWMELQSKLYELDWFDKIDPIALPADAAKTKVSIKFTVVEKPAIETVRVIGNSGIKSTDILDAVTEKAGDIYNQAKTKVDELAVRRLYLEKGYPDATVSSTSSPGKAKSSVVLSFNVSEGAQVDVKEIRFTGNTAVSSQTLKGKMSLKESAFLQSGAFQESKLEDDKKTIVDYYKSRGYVDAAIEDVVRSYEKDPKTSKSWLIVTVVISEGKQWNFGGIKFEGNSIFSSEKLGSLISAKPGTVINYKKLMQEKAKVDDLYYESGYIFNSISLSETRDEEKKSIAYTVNIVEQDRAHIESIAFKGNKKTKDFVLYRELPLEVGDIFSKAKIIEGLRNLYNLQYFSAIDPQMFPGSSDNLMNLVISVEEQSMADINFGVTLTGLGEPDTVPVTGVVKWDDRNFLGNGTDLAIEADAAWAKQVLSVGYTDKYFFGKRFSGGVNLSMSHKVLTTGQDIIAPIFDDGVPDPFTSESSGGYSLSSIPAAYRMPYDSWDLSLAFTTGYSFRTPVGDLGAGGALSFGYGMKSYDEDRYRPASEYIRTWDEQWRMGNKLIGRVYLNNLDLSYNPSKGYYLSEKLTLAGFVPDLETQQYFKTETKAEAYATLFNIPVFENWNLKMVLGAHSDFQRLFDSSFGDSPTVTDDWLLLDGVFNARGWNSLYGLEGIGLWENWLELRMPIFEQVLWLDGFLDMAALQTQGGLVDMTLDTPASNSKNADFSSLGWDNMAFSLGFGPRFALQQFPFRFYFVKRFTFDQDQTNFWDKFNWKNPGEGLEIVISVTQPL